MDVSATLFIDGQWRATAAGNAVINPATGQTLSRQAVAGPAETLEAVRAASKALTTWRATSPFERSEILGRASRLISGRANEIGFTLALETGKLLREAIGEVRFAADYFSWFAGEARRLEWMSAIQGRASGQQVVLRKPAGVVAALTPWNFPVSIQARKIAAALAAGCTVVSRPSEFAPDSVVALYKCLQEAGLPDGAANLLTGPASGITDTLLDSAEVRVITFTGSTQVGKRLYTRSAPTMKRLALELGGCAPFIVCEDADLSLALNQAMIAKFRNCGQSCLAANTFYVADRLYEAFVSGLADRIQTLRLGDPLLEETTIGPLINRKRRRALEELQAAAPGAGFELIASAKPLADGGDLSAENFLAPALYAAPALKGVNPAFLQEEIFGPLACVVGFSDLAELLTSLAQNPLGLGGYLFSENISQALKNAARLEVGITGINDSLPSAANVPMGGVKDSGLGREGGHQGIEEFLDTQYIGLGKPLI
jgi:succinate-semialdehyde dehydrogenase/glutarate-semialdehyde dehydrogenase